ncbi:MULTISPECIES: type II toxin-antitoxin system RelE/ParE family toxin [Aerosakkonema]|uniref:type II toxin-antitoxin system RelE/ParE family toxin n=1 Tax=Aerosakkonema TaxID=1246629 RepID=UPI0035B6DBAF
MTRRISISPRASFDLDDHFEYIAESNFDAAVRFFDSARQTFAKIAQTPGIGKRCVVENPRLAGLRKWGVKGFENYLIFYLDSGEIVEIVRILHAARDIPTILEMEE